MRRTQLIKELRKIAKDQGVEFAEVREGGNHTIYSLGDQQIPIPRHRDINDRLADRILKEARK